MVEEIKSPCQCKGYDEYVLTAYKYTPFTEKWLPSPKLSTILKKSSTRIIYSAFLPDSIIVEKVNIIVVMHPHISVAWC